MTQNQKSWMKVGFSLLMAAVILTPLNKIVTYYLKIIHINGCNKVVDKSMLNINGTDITLTAVLVAAGLLCILPVSDWLKHLADIIRAWRRK